LIHPVTQKLNNTIYSSPVFKKKKTSEDVPEKLGDDNPISRKGEVMNLIKTTFIGGLGLGAYLAFELIDSGGDFVLDSLFTYSNKLANKNPDEIKKIEQEIKNKQKEIKNNKILKTIGIFGAFIAVGLSGFAILYTAFQAPKISYESKVNAFKKGKEMDVYIKANDAEKEFYEQIDEKAKNATPEEKERLKEQYLKMRNAKNQVPDYVKL